MVNKKKNQTLSNKTENSKICAILTYLLIGIIWYFVDEKMKKDEFVKFHTKQSLTLIVLFIIGSIALSILQYISFILIPILDLIFFIMMVIGIINAANNEKKELPIIGKFSSIFNF